MPNQFTMNDVTCRIFRANNTHISFIRNDCIQVTNIRPQWLGWHTVNNTKTKNIFNKSFGRQTMCMESFIFYAQETLQVLLAALNRFIGDEKKRKKENIFFLLNCVTLYNNKIALFIAIFLINSCFFFFLLLRLWTASTFYACVKHESCSWVGSSSCSAVLY